MTGEEQQEVSLLGRLSMHDPSHSSASLSFFQVRTSFFEIYGNSLFDLLNDRKKLRCLEDAKQRAVVMNLTETRVHK